MKPLGLGWPNIVTVFRILMAPVLVALILVQERSASYAAAVVFVAGALTDGLDGYLARRHAMTTSTGMWLDPLSDKLFVAAPIVTLLALGRFPLWAAIMIIAREVAVSLLRLWLGSRRASMPASDVAKLKTGAQVVAITLYLLPLTSAESARVAALVVAVVLTLYSGVDYFVRARAVAGAAR